VTLRGRVIGGVCPEVWSLLMLDSPLAALFIKAKAIEQRIAESTSKKEHGRCLIIADNSLY